MEVNKMEQTTEKIILVKSRKHSQEECKNSSSFQLPTIDSQYFGENSDTEVQELLDEARQLIKEKDRLECDKLQITNEIFNLRNSKIYLEESVFTKNFKPKERINKVFNNIITLLEKGSRLDHCKAKLELDKIELKRRMCILQKAIHTYESKTNLPTITPQ